jgi:DNA-binding NarL/FixJ family response regulator
MHPIHVLIADDHMLVRGGIRALLEHVPDVQVVAEARDGHEALHLIATHQPHIVLMDITMPGLNGIEVTMRVAKEFPHVRVIIFSMHAVEEYVLQALHAGAAGYLVKSAAPVELALAVTAIARGDMYLSPAIAKYAVTNYLHQSRSERGRNKAVSTPYVQLTARQREILQLIAAGYTTKGMAQRLGLSVRTVDTHRTQIMQRLDIHDIAGLVRYAVQSKLVGADIG